MEFSVKGKFLRFKNSEPAPNEYYATLVYKGVSAELTIDCRHFENGEIDWTFVKYHVSNFIENFDFINSKSAKITKDLYNEYGEGLEERDRFDEHGCYFLNQLFVEFLKPSAYRLFPNDNGINYIVENVIFCEFTYWSTQCIFADYGYLVGVRSKTADIDIAGEFNH